MTGTATISKVNEVKEEKPAYVPTDLEELVLGFLKEAIFNPKNIKEKAAVATTAIQ